MPGQVAQNGAMAILNFFTGNAQEAPPAAPTLATATTGGTVLAGAYKVTATYVNAFGESVASAQATITTTGSTSTITISSPAAQAGATGWYAYVSQVGGSTLTRQQAPGSPTAIGTNLVLTAPPTSSGVQATWGSFQPATQSLYLALLVANPATSASGGTPAILISDLQEDATSGYARQAVTFSAASAAVPSQASNTGTITFGPYTANQSVPVQWAALVTAQTGSQGLLLYTWQLDTAEQVQTSQPIVIPAGALILDQG